MALSAAGLTRQSTADAADVTRVVIDRSVCPNEASTMPPGRLLSDNVNNVDTYAIPKKCVSMENRFPIEPYPDCEGKKKYKYGAMMATMGRIPDDVTKMIKRDPMLLACIRDAIEE
ncbi:MAG: hypothetical protein FWD57_14045 [Polyangiaceae bacterium]|nr:hypothetical protein [Polyangiaceae bacterium]